MILSSRRSATLNYILADNHMPYLPFPESWPVFTPKDKLADWLELYVGALDLRVSTGTSLASATFDGKKWTVKIVRISDDGTSLPQIFYPRHIIQATGQSGSPNIPQLPGISTFKGTPPLHSSQFLGPSRSQGNGRRAVVIGSSNSAHDIAQSFHEHGYHVTMVQRSSSCVDPTQYKQGKGLYAEGGPMVEDADFEKEAEPTAVMKRKQIDVTTKLKETHWEYFESLEAAGFKLNWGPDGSGYAVLFSLLLLI
jgi:cation diffusion facilitator CzcD-associated flavoprotein CzcO